MYDSPCIVTIKWEIKKWQKNPLCYLFLIRTNLRFWSDNKLKTDVGAWECPPCRFRSWNSGNIPRLESEEEMTFRTKNEGIENRDHILPHPGTIVGSSSLDKEGFSLYIFLCWPNKVVYIHAVALRPQPLARASIFPEQFKWTWNWKQMWAPACYCTRANGAQGGKGGGGGRDRMKGPSAAPGLSSLEGVWTPNSTSLHSENELLTENRWEWTSAWGRGNARRPDGESVVRKVREWAELEKCRVEVY